MKTFTVTIPEKWRAQFGPTRTINADYCIVREGALVFLEVHGDAETGLVHWLAGGSQNAQPQVMVNEFPAGFWSSVTPAHGEPR